MTKSKLSPRILELKRLVKDASCEIYPNSVLYQLWTLETLDAPGFGREKPVTDLAPEDFPEIDEFWIAHHEIEDWLSVVTSFLEWVHEL